MVGDAQGMLCSMTRRARTSGRSCMGSTVGAPPQPLFSGLLKRLRMNDPRFGGVGYDVIDVRVLTAAGDSVDACFMLDTGVTTNLVTSALFDRLGVPIEAGQVDGAALVGSLEGLSATKLPGFELAGPANTSTHRWICLREDANGSRAWGFVDWDSLLAEARSANGRVVCGKLEWIVCAVSAGEMLEDSVGRRFVEHIEGEMAASGSHFKGKGTSIDQGCPIAITDAFDFHLEGDVLVDRASGLRFRQSLPLPGPIPATLAPTFMQEEMADFQGIRLGGILGQLPLHRAFAIEVDPVAGRYAVHLPESAGSLAAAGGLQRLPGVRLGSGLFGLLLVHAPLCPSAGGASAPSAVPAIVDSGSSITIFNWPAAEALLGIRRGDRVVAEAPRVRAVGVGGGQSEMPVVVVSVGLVGVAEREGDPVLLRLPPSRARCDRGRRHLQGARRGAAGRLACPSGTDRAGHPLTAALPARVRRASHLHVRRRGRPVERVAGARRHRGLPRRHGRRLRGLQKLGCSPDEAAQVCLSMPPGVCQGVAVTPKGRFQGLCYVHVGTEDGVADLAERGWRRYDAPEGQELAPAGAAVASTTGEREPDDARCYALRAA
ncbi:unnamed protein product [Prorocentrum cordatum]|uniref:Peptidase A2 domain-containing protein n=1 Tax=Prorocentrum cordatum TaxID=2364126 RepID=A0ABN9QKG1_9DINO|nr:unnamed protein product [Polarella glacialis]